MMAMLWAQKIMYAETKEEAIALYKKPYEGGTGSLLEVVDMMCGVTEKLADIVRKQAVLIEQERIAGAVFPADLSEERKQAEDDLDRIEMKLRRI